jgi:hypothetical protein
VAEEERQSRPSSTERHVASLVEAPSASDHPMARSRDAQIGRLQSAARGALIGGGPGREQRARKGPAANSREHLPPAL